MSASVAANCIDRAARGAAIVLQRHGERPLRFFGAAIACSEGGGEPAWAQLRLALYSSDGGGYVTELRATPSAAHNLPAWCHAAAAPTLEAAVEQFEKIHALPPLSCPADGDQPGAAKLFQAAGRLCREAAQAHALRHAIGNFLLRLACTGALPATPPC